MFQGAASSRSRSPFYLLNIIVITAETLLPFTFPKHPSNFACSRGESQEGKEPFLFWGHKDKGLCHDRADIENCLPLNNIISLKFHPLNFTCRKASMTEVAVLNLGSPGQRLRSLPIRHWTSVDDNIENCFLHTNNISLWSSNFECSYRPWAENESCWFCGHLVIRSRSRQDQRWKLVSKAMINNKQYFVM